MSPLTLLVGATGSAGRSVLRACTASPDAGEIRAVTLRPLDQSHAKVRPFVHHDFTDFTAVAEAFTGVDACVFCLGVSVTQVPDEAPYRVITHDYTLAAARALKADSPAAAFHDISGQGTHAEGWMMWARVKGATERELMDAVGAVCWRPAFIDGEPPANGSWMLKSPCPPCAC